MCLVMRAAPARAGKDLTGLPDAFICVGTLDILRDEDIEYARRLLAAGVETELHVYPGAPHRVRLACPRHHRRRPLRLRHRSRR